jgi:hypothetical protein
MAGSIRPVTMRDLRAMLGPDDQTLVFPLAQARQINTDGTAGSTIIDASSPEIEQLGPYVASVQAFTAMENKSTNFRWKVQFQGSITGRTYNTITDLFAFVTSNGEAAQTAYTAVENLGLRTRWGLVCSPSTGTAVESGIVWCYLAFRLRR